MNRFEATCARIAACSILLMAGLVAGCATTTDLEPAPGANEVADLEDAAVSRVNGVQVLAQADTWPGTAPISQEVTPVRVVIENNSSQPLRIRYNDFALVSADGQRFAALPLYGIEGTVEEPVTAEAYTPVTNPVFTYTDFTVAPYYSTIYPGITPFAGAFAFDPFYYDTYVTYWRDRSLPTTEMFTRALPEGVVMPNGRVDGWLYFEEVGDARRVTFRADLTEATRGRSFGEIRIPFMVE